MVTPLKVNLSGEYVSNQARTQVSEKGSRTPTLTSFDQYGVPDQNCTFPFFPSFFIPVNKEIQEK